MRRHGGVGAVIAMAVHTADDAVPAHRLRTGKNCRAPRRGRDAPATLRAWVDPMDRTFHTRENARPGRVPPRGASIGSPPVRRPSVALRARAPMGYSSGRDPPDVV